MTDSRKVVVVVELEREEAEAYADDYVSQDDPRIHDALEAVDKIQAAIRRALAEPVEAVWMCGNTLNAAVWTSGHDRCLVCIQDRDQHRRVYVIELPRRDSARGTDG